MNEPRQAIHANMGQFGCYLFSIVHLAEQVTASQMNDYAAHQAGTARGLIGPDCYILDPAGLLSLLTGQKWTSTKEDPSYQIKPGEIAIIRFGWTEQQVGKSIEHAHFVCPDWDPFGDSLTVKNGSVASLRIFRRA